MLINLANKFNGGYITGMKKLYENKSDYPITTLTDQNLFFLICFVTGFIMLSLKLFDSPLISLPCVIFLVCVLLFVLKGVKKDLLTNKRGNKWL